MTTFTFTLTEQNGFEVEDLVNNAVAEGKTVTVNGTLAKYRFGAPAHCWNNGSLSVKTPARTTRGTAERWFKLGATVTVEVS